MTQKDVYSNDDGDDSCSNMTVDRDETDIEWNSVQCQRENNINGFRVKDCSLQLPTSTIPDKAPISHISSVALQNSTDITFGNKTLYNGPITVNQFGLETPTSINFGKTAAPFFSQWKIILTIAITVTILVSVATILVVYFKNGKADTGVINIDNDNTPLRLVTRKEWKAKPATGELDNLSTPVSLVIIQHTVQSSCDTMETCALLVRQAQILHIYSGDIGDEIGYNFLVGGDGAAYEGRGWEKIGAHTRGYNSKSIGIAFIGDFRQEKPTNKQIVALLKLLRDGVKMNKIAENYTLIGGNQVQQTESPGKMLFQILTELPHWSDQID